MLYGLINIHVYIHILKVLTVISVKPYTTKLAVTYPYCIGINRVQAVLQNKRSN